MFLIDSKAYPSVKLSAPGALTIGYLNNSFSSPLLTNLI